MASPINFPIDVYENHHHPKALFTFKLNGGGKYYFTWAQLRKHPNFTFTKRVFAENQKVCEGHAKTFLYTGGPEQELMPFVLRYIRDGVKIDISTVCYRLGIDHKDAIMYIEGYGLGMDACKDLYEIKTPDV